VEVVLKILMTGATGLIGRNLSKTLTEDGHTVVSLSRSSKKPAGLAAAEHHQWDYEKGMPPDASLSEIDAVMNLAGEPIAAHRWSDDQKRLMRESRVILTKKLVDSFRTLDRRPAVFVSGSAVGYYGDRKDEVLEETSPPGRGFMSELCEEWEREAMRAVELGIRVVLVRTGVVLSAQGGALKKMLPPFKLGVGGPMGSGKQWFPWIHIDDIVGIFRHAIYTSTITGPLNGSAPQPVTNAEFTRELAGALHRPAFLPVPRIAMQVLMGEMSEVVFVSERAVPKAVLASGYKFAFSTLASALANLFEKDMD